MPSADVSWPDAVLALVLGYVLGCLNAGYYLVRWRTGRDLREAGSGTAGATNAGRVLGRPGFVLTLLLDAAKGALAALLARVFHLPDPWLLVTLAAVLAGHIWPAQLRFRGGKGIAPFLGGMLVLQPVWLAVYGGVVGLAWLALRRFTLAGLSALLSLVLLAAWRGSSPDQLGAFALLVAIILVAHRHNIRNEIAGSLLGRPTSRPPEEKPAAVRRDEHRTPDRL